MTSTSSSPGFAFFSPLKCLSSSQESTMSEGSIKKSKDEKKHKSKKKIKESSDTSSHYSETDTEKVVASHMSSDMNEIDRDILSIANQVGEKQDKDQDEDANTEFSLKFSPVKEILNETASKHKKLKLSPSKRKTDAAKHGISSSDSEAPSQVKHKKSTQHAVQLSMNEKNNDKPYASNTSESSSELTIKNSLKRFQCPETLSSVTITSTQDISYETLQQKNHEVWLIRAPAAVDLQNFNGCEVVLNGITTPSKKEKSSDTGYEIHALHGKNKNSDDVSLLVPDKHGQLRKAPSFAGQLYFTESLCVPPVLLPPVSKKPYTDRPTGLKLRYKPIGWKTPLVSRKPGKKETKSKVDDENEKSLQDEIDQCDKKIEDFLSPATIKYKKEKKKKKKHKKDKKQKI